MFAITLINIFSEISIIFPSRFLSFFSQLPSKLHLFEILSLLLMQRCSFPLEICSEIECLHNVPFQQNQLCMLPPAAQLISTVFKHHLNLIGPMENRAIQVYVIT